MNTNTLLMAFGPVSLDNIIPLYIADELMMWTVEYTFIGITYTSTARNIFRAHYTLKEIKPLSINRTTLAAETYTGPLPVWEGCLL